MTNRRAFLWVFGVLALTAVPGGGEQPNPPKPVIGPEWKAVEESAVLPTGAKAHAAYHFNRNALSAACFTDEALLAVTDSGNLLRFDPKDLRLQQEVRPETAITLLTATKGSESWLPVPAVTCSALIRRH
jgi:hypothetical protein